MKDVLVVFFGARIYNFESRHRRERGREFLAVWSEEGKEGLPNFCRLLRGTEINTSRPWDRLAWCDQGGPGRACHRVRSNWQPVKIPEGRKHGLLLAYGPQYERYYFEPFEVKEKKDKVVTCMENLNN